MTTRSNLYVDQGTDFFITLDLETDDGDPIDVSSFDFSCSVRKMYSSKVQFSPEVEVESTANTELDFPVISLHISPEDTIGIRPGKYEYDILMRKDNGSIKKILEGLIFVLPTIATWSANT